jgi:ribose transport system substrate-binding protein
VQRRLRASFRVVVLILAFGAKGCKEESTKNSKQPSSSTPQKVIGVSLLTLQHQFYQELRDGLESTAAEYGYRPLIVSAEFDSSRQSNQIDEFIVQKVDAIVVCPCDSRSVGASITAANQANIPVFTADIANLSAMGKVVSHIASDNVQGGREAAKLLATAIGNKGTVAILSHPEVASVTDRVRGLKEELDKHPDIRVVAELSADGRRDKAVRVTEDLLASHADLAGIFAINDDTALGALATVESAGKVGQIQIVGYDATPEARSKIASGAIYGDVVQNPRQIGELTMRTIHSFLIGNTPPPIIAVDVATITRERT